MSLIDRFQKYYIDYLGLSLSSSNNNHHVFSSIQRDKPINTWYFQTMIATSISGNYAYSISPSYYKDFMQYITECEIPKNFEELSLQLDNFFSTRLEGFKIRKTCRYTVDKLADSTATISATELTKDILMNSIKNLSDEKKKIVWSRKKEEVENGRQFVILDRKKIVAYCKISDIFFGGGNLVVWTAPEYRGKGYARATLTAATKWCLNNNLLPIYWLEQSNIASMQLAKSLGYKQYAEEIVVSRELQI